MHPITVDALLALQSFHVLFLALLDWIPLGTLNDVKGVRAANSGGKLLAATLISLAPFAVGLAASASYFGRGRALAPACPGGSRSESLRTFRSVARQRLCGACFTRVCRCCPRM